MSKKIALLLFFVVLKIVLQFSLVHPVYQLHRDEYLHIDQGRHLAAGYLSVPPLTGILSGLILRMGNVDFWVRFFPALFGALTIAIVWKSIMVLRGGIYALVLGCSIVLLSALLRLNILYQPNSFDILAWTFIGYSVLMYLHSKKDKWIWIIFIAFALGFLNKYNVVFLMTGLVLSLMLTVERKLFLKPKLYYAALLALLLVMPNLYWQFQNGFPVVAHLRELNDTQLVHVQRSDFIKEQLLFFAGGLPVLIAALISLIYYPPFKTYRVFIFLFFTTLGLFIFFKAKPYYAIGLYPIYFAFGAVWIEQKFKSHLQKWVLRPILILLPIAFFILVLNFAFPNKTPEAFVAQSRDKQNGFTHRWEDGNMHPIAQDFADMLGWKELAAIVDSAYETISNKNQTLIYCDNYGQAGAINYYSRHKSIQAISLNADYVNWIPENWQWQHCIRIKDRDDDSNEKRYFEKVLKAGKITNPFARELGTTVFILINANDSAKKIVNEEINAAKKRYRE